MGESICLVRSFSQPAEFSSHETNQVVPPGRVLTESVSFGRFANETLSWEKWSAFTQNRYLEEVERFTKPGSVAQKKAFFEAHFKNRAAGRVTQTNKIQEVKDILVDSEVVVSNGMGMDEVRHGEMSKTEVVSVPLVPVIDDVQTGEVENLKSVIVPEDSALDEEDSTLLSKERRSSSSGSKVCITSSKLDPFVVIGLDHSVKNTRKESSSGSKTSISVSKKSRSPPEPVHISISCVTSGNTEKTIVQNGSKSSTIAKSAGKAEKKKRSGPNAVHMSLNFASSARPTTITAPKRLARNSTTQETTSSNAKNSGNEPTGALKSRKRPLPRTSKEGSKAAKCSTSASAVTLPQRPPLNNQLSENKRKNIYVGSSVSCKIPNNVQRQPSDSENLLTQSRTKAKSVTVSSPFVFRSDERAERRKEFFKKLEEKNKKEDAEKGQLFCGFKANQNTHLASEEHKKNPQVGCFQVPLTSMTSPRFRRSQTSGTVQTHKASSTKTINTRKAVIEKVKSSKIHPSSKSLTKIKTQENLSPNIL
ncbi:PREDICTED: protein WVD2-like 7 isoform X2 [Camelina sativa]|uniref:Protein WVD2-like 7 isoform X2 n=1 Tax=Camelina sativa TaxID=90675 RepID=A0ABM1QGM2_CAMSA|nr:PREDICTED: protein WVD2-like 7 isoform X2 [Camelina sativa]